MSDWTDDATELEQRQRDLSLAARVIYEGESLSECAECGDQIGSGRQLAVPGCTMCTDCASMAEARR